MELNKERIGNLITLCNEKNTKSIDLPIMGINKDKEFMPTVANTNSIDKSKYKIMKKGRFVFSGMQTGRDNCIRIGLYDKDDECLVSPAYTTFEVTSPLIMPEYLFMFFNSKEKDRYGAFLSDGSIRSNLDWDVFCDIKIDLPKIEIQEKYVNIYNNLKKNISIYSSGLEDLNKTAEMYIENLRRKNGSQPIGDLIIEVSEKNAEEKYKRECGISIEKKFINTKAHSSDIKNQKIVYKNYFAFNCNTSRNSDTLSIALNKEEPCIVSNTYITFKCDENKLMPDYLLLWLKRKEFDRYARFNSWGSARETISLNEIKDYKINVPNLDIQKSIIKIHSSYIERKDILDKLIKISKKICPILIKGSLEEAMNE